MNMVFLSVKYGRIPKTIGRRSNHFRFHFHIILPFLFLLFFGNYFHFHLALKVDKTSKTIVKNKKLSFPFSSLPSPSKLPAFLATGGRRTHFEADFLSG